MRFNLKIKGIGQSVPKNKLTNKDIESITPNSKAEWIHDKLGIKERRIATNSDNVVTLGTNASREALNDSNLTAKNLDLIIVNTSSADKISPSVACMIQKELGATCPAFDINAVCSGFIYSLEIVSHLLEKYNNILMVSTETYSKITDWENRNSCFFGDGAAALIVSKSDKNNLEIILGADGEGWEHFNCDRDSKFNMNGKEVYKFGVTTLPREINILLEQLNLNISQIDYMIPHQPSHNVLKETARLLNLPESKVCFNMINYGNTAGASIPMALYKLIKENKIINNDNLLLAAIGSGWTYGNVHLGNNVRIDPFTLITTALETGDNIQICSHVVLGGGKTHKIKLGNWSWVGYGSKLFCASEDYTGEYGPVNEFWGNNKIYRGDITFNDYSGIASDVMVFPGVTLPEGCAVGAKSFIHTKNSLKPWGVYIGNPAELHKPRNKETTIRLSKGPNFLQK